MWSAWRVLGNTGTDRLVLPLVDIGSGKEDLPLILHVFRILYDRKLLVDPGVQTEERLTSFGGMRPQRKLISFGSKGMIHRRFRELIGVEVEQDLE